jgi:hypothetical protein
MNLTFQLARGAFALALGAALSIAALLAPRVESGNRLVLVVADTGSVAIVCPLPAPVLRLAAAPADLPALHSSVPSCRA